VPMNEIVFGNAIFGGAYFLDPVEKIEINRGPGSAIYGGFAELAVVNVISRGPEMNGVSVSANHGWLDGGDLGYQQATVSMGGRSGDLGLSLHLGAGRGFTGAGDYTDYTDEVFALEDFGGFEAWYANFGAAYKDLHFRYIGSYYSVESSMAGYWDDTHTVFTPGWDDPLVTQFYNHHFDLYYDARVTDTLTITPRFTWSEIDGWRCDNNVSREAEIYYRIPTRQLRSGLTAHWQAGESVGVMVGGEYTDDQAFIKPDAPDWFAFSDGSDHRNYHTKSAFGQVELKTGAGNLTAGARYDEHSQFGSAFVPRVAYTKAWEKVHVKALASRAYRAPTISNIDLNQSIDPEFTTTYEVEVGGVIGERDFITVNIFDTKIEDPIVYFIEGSESNYGYRNFDSAGSRGVEAEYRHRQSWGYVSLGYSYYQAYDNEVDLYEARDEDGHRVGSVYLGAPTHKGTLNANYYVNKELSLNGSVVYLSERYNTYWSDAAGDFVNQELDPVVVANLYARYTPSFAPGVEVGIGVFNLFDEDYDLVPGYSNYDRETPTRGREYMVKLTWHGGF